MLKLKLLGTLLMPIIILLNWFSVRPLQITTQKSVDTIDHSLWDGLLKKHVDNEGLVDYAKFRNDGASLKVYLDHLAENPISHTATKEERLAYYINLYNAGTVHLILENYPLKSIKDIFRPWGKDRLFIGDKEYSLAEIEHGILRKMDEPRIHFAINCASFSCPKLRNEAYKAIEMEAQLEKATIDFINDSSKNKISKDLVQLSKIFKWYKGDFNENGSLIDYLNRYSHISLSDGAKITFLNYDWRLNE
jgi:hypothetical protein